MRDPFSFSLGGVRLGAVLAAASVLLAACGDGSPSRSENGDVRPSVVVTTNILGDVVSEIAGGAAEVTVVMPVGSNPHDFQPSAQQAAAMRQADLLVVNGGGFEEGLLDLVEGAEADGVPVYEALSAVAALDLAEDDETPAEEDPGAVDPHFFTDPTRMADAVNGIRDALVEEVPSIDVAALDAAVEEYVSKLDELDTEVEALLAAVPEDDRVLVTNHEVFEYFADRYGFEVVGVVVPGGTTESGTSAGQMAELVQVIEREDVKAIFGDSSSPGLAETLADEVGDVEVVELFSESLGEQGSGGESYLEMVRTNAERVAAALR